MKRYRITPREDYPKCPTCGGPVVGAMMTSKSHEIDGERYYHPDAISVYCQNAECNYDRNLYEIPSPAPATQGKK
jgi:hypothetical protein